MTRKITFHNLKPSPQLHNDLTIAYNRVMMSGIYINGLEAEVFSHEWAEYCQRKYCILTASGLDAIKLVLRAWGIGRNDTVYVPAWGCVQTWLAARQVEALPLNIPKIVPADNIPYICVHLYGALHNTSVFKGDKVLHDACQAHGLRGVGDPAVYSFYPTKNLGCYGDGGAIITDDKDLFDKLLAMIPHSAKRMDELQCAFLRAKLPYLDMWNEQRKQNAERYLNGLENVTLPDNLNSVWHQFVIQYSDEKFRKNKLYQRNYGARNWLQEKLHKRGIETMIHYPAPPHRQLGYNYNLPKADRMAETVLSLPVAPHLTNNDIDYVIEAINELT